MAQTLHHPQHADGTGGLKADFQKHFAFDSQAARLLGVQGGWFRENLRGNEAGRDRLLRFWPDSRGGERFAIPEATLAHSSAISIHAPGAVTDGDPVSKPGTRDHPANAVGATGPVAVSRSR